MSSPAQMSGVHDCIVAQSKETPNAVAVRHKDKGLTYAELDMRSTQLARYMMDDGLTKGAVVGVCLPPSFELVVAMLAIWKMGAIYLPLETEYPAERLVEMVDEAGSRIVVTLAPISYPFQRPGTCIIYIDAHSEYIDEYSIEPLPSLLHPDDLAYLMYTSGSTGKPKGVMLTHAALLNKIQEPGTWGTVTARCRSVLLTSIAFDPSIVQILLPLAHGGSVLLISSSERLKAERIWRILAAQAITVIDCTPSWLQAMLSQPTEGFSPERIVIGGEILTPSFAQRVNQEFPHSQLVNIYGPTETCIDATAHVLKEQDLRAATIPIGKALPGYTLHILRDDQSVALTGEIGELYISGIGLARGYWRNPIATSKAFIANPLKPSERLYRTGDMVRLMADGVLEYVGRRDDQVKLRGQRVEMGEIENAMAQLPNVESAVVKVWPAKKGLTSQLVGYAVLNDPVEPTEGQLSKDNIAQQLRDDLAQRLPSYMVPSVIDILDSLPLSTTGKVDKTALSQPTKSGAKLDDKDLPRDDSEVALVEIWTEVLGDNQISIHDNFFELGIDSLTAVQLLSRVNKAFNTDLPLNVLLTHPTVADLALALARGTQTIETTESRRILRLSGRSESNAPLFFLPPRSGVGLVYVGLARELSGTTPTIALQTVDMPGDGVGNVTMPQLISELVSDVERTQPTGPIRLCGYSAGGPVACQMAKELEAKGRPVSHLVLLDPYCADYSDWPDSEPANHTEETFWEVCLDMIADTTALRGTSAEQVLSITKCLWNEILRNDMSSDNARYQSLLDEAAAILPEHIDPRFYLLLLEGVGNLWFAFANEKPPILPELSGEICFIQPDGDSMSVRQQRIKSWQQLLPKAITPVLVPGEHITILNRSRSVKAIGAHLRNLLGGN